MDTAFVLV